jgi:hypothetical protein
VAVDVQGFMPQTNLFKEGMDAFQTGAKLPLLLEQIKHEKKRIKMENAKLDYAASEAGQQAENQKRMLEMDAVRAKIERDQAEINKLQAEAQGAAIVDRGVSLGDAVSRPATPLADAQITTASEGLNLVDEGLDSPRPFTFTGDAARLMAPGVEAVTPPAVTPPAVADDYYVPVFASGRRGDPLAALQGQIPAMTNDDPVEYGREKLLDRLNREFPPYRGPRKDEAAYNDKKRVRALELEKEFTPVDATISVRDDRGVPLAIPVRNVGGEVVQILGEPYIDVNGLSKAQQKKDETFAAAQSDPQYVSNQVTRDINIERLLTAGQYLIEAKNNWNPTDTKIAGFLPESVRQLFGSDREKARNEARTVIQQQLRATLGAQFAFKEGEMMLNRGFNILFDDETNLGLLRSAAQTILTISREQDRAQRYEAANGTLAGFSFNQGLVTEHPVLSKFDAAITAVSSDATKKAPTTTAIPEASQTYRSKRKKRDK